MQQPGYNEGPPTYGQVQNDYGAPQPQYGAPPQNNYGGGPVQNQNQYQPQQINTQGAVGVQAPGTVAPGPGQPPAAAEPTNPGEKGCCGCSNPCCGFYGFGTICRIIALVICLVFCGLAIAINQVKTCHYDNSSFYGDTDVWCRTDGLRYSYDNWSSDVQLDYSDLKDLNYSQVKNDDVDEAEAMAKAQIGLAITGLVFAIIAILWDVIMPFTGLGSCAKYGCLQFLTILVFIFWILSSGGSNNSPCCDIVQDINDSQGLTGDDYDVDEDQGSGASGLFVMFAWIILINNMVIVWWQVEHKCYGRPENFDDKCACW